MNDKLKEKIIDEFELQIAEINSHLSRKTGHFLISYLDKDILNLIIEHIENIKNIKFKHLKDFTESSRLEKNIIPIFYIKKRSKSFFNASIYNLMEISKKRLVIFTTQNSSLLDVFERRIRSRFSHKIVFIQYSKEFSGFIPPSFQNFNKHDIMKKYSIPKYEFINTLNILTSIHFAVLLLCRRNTVNYLDVASKFNRFVISVRELSKTNNSIVVSAFYDLLEYELIRENGEWVCDFEIVKSFIRENQPIYVQRLL